MRSEFVTGISGLAKRLTSTPATTRESAITRMERGGALTHLMSSLEHLANGKERQAGGVNNWEITRDNSLVTSAAGRRFLDFIARPEATAAVHVARIAAAAAVLAPRSSPSLRTAANGALAASSVVMHPRHHYGTDGSDQVSFLASAAAFVARSAGKRTAVTDHVLWAVALQATLSYAVSGWAKLAGRSWREGTALSGVTRTMTYGDRRFWELTQRFPRLARLLGVSVLALECTFPLAYAARGRLANGYIAGTTAFHLGVGQVMGLGRFVPSFMSMHGPVQYTARPSSDTEVEGRRDDSLLRTSALVGAGLIALAVQTRQANRRRALAGRGDERQLELRDGNRITYRVTGTADESTPVFVLENAMLSTTEHWEWFVRALGDHGTVVTYNRPGYAGSTARRGTAIVVDDLVGGLTEVVEHVAADRPVVLVGHSLGGYIALRAVDRLDRAPLAVCLVDSTHSEELKRSPRQDLGAKSVSDGLSLITPTLAAGAGLLLEVPAWVRSMPREAQASMLAQYRDARMWRAAKREWHAILRDFRNPPRLPRSDVPILSLSAERTVVEDETQGAMHRELADLSSAGRHVVVRGADHDSIVTERHTAQVAVSEILEFVEVASSAHSDRAHEEVA